MRTPVEFPQHCIGMFEFKKNRRNGRLGDHRAGCGSLGL
jgi:hypothetical protein